MNQTVTVNISGIVFHIEVDAYENLKKYLNKIRSYFKNAEESEEIMTDIEARIAELFNEKITSDNQVVNTKDVEEVITIMGKPEQYVEEDEEPVSEKTYTSQRTYASAKKLFRDSDDRMIGGVASGIAAYFGVASIWVRLFFVLSTLIWGFGPLVYFILWLVMPEAKTASDKIQMKGDPVNIDNLSKTFKDEADRVSDHLKSNGQQYGKKAEAVVGGIFNFIGQIIKGVFKVLGKVFGVLFLLIGLIFLTSTMLWLTVGDRTILSISDDGVFAAVQSPELFNLIFPSSDMYHIFMMILVVVIGMPFVALVYAGLKLLFNVKTHFSVGLSMFILWLVGTICCAFLVFYVAKDQKNKDYITESNVLTSQYVDYEITLLENLIDGEEIIETSDLMILSNNDSIYMNRVSLNIKKSEINEAKIQVDFESRGFSKKDARENANAISYQYKVKDSVISFSEFLSVPKEGRLRAQEVNVTISLPIGRSIYLDNSLGAIIYDIDNVTRTRDRKMLGKRWVMLENGLTCLDCAEIDGVTTLQLDSIKAIEPILIKEK